MFASRGQIAGLASTDLYIGPKSHTITYHFLLKGHWQ